MLTFDLETHLSVPGNKLPKPVCVSMCFDDKPPSLWYPEQALKLILDYKGLFNNHAISFDFAVLAYHFNALQPILDIYYANRVYCTYVRDKLICTAQGLPYKEHSLSDLVKRYLNLDISHTKKGDVWRLRYAELDGIPFEQWPDAAVTYSLNDVIYARDVLIHQGYEKRVSPDETKRTLLDFCLIFWEARGLRTDVNRVLPWLDKQKKLADEQVINTRKHNLTDVFGRKKVNNIRETIKQTLGDDTPLTAKGNINTNKATLRQCATSNEGLKALINLNEASTMLSGYGKILIEGLTKPIHPRYDVLLETGRVGASKPAITNLPRKGGVRDCFVPTTNGNVFIFCDYVAAELVSLAEVCTRLFGYSKLAELINLGIDPHLWLAHLYTGRSYQDLKHAYVNGDEKVRLLRQEMKAVNFGFPGGLGIAVFIQNAKDVWGVTVTSQKAEELKALWFSAYPEMRQYFAYITELQRSYGGSGFTITQLVSNRVRGNLRFTQGCNTYFQGLTADGATHAAIQVTLECLDARYNSVLYGNAFPVVFAHDEIILECIPTQPILTQCAIRLESIMVKSMQDYINSVKVSTELAASNRWKKGAQPIWRDNLLHPDNS